MKKVLIPLTVLKQSEHDIAPRHYARETYIQKLINYNLLPIFVSTAMPTAMVNELYNLCQGVLFMGGLDVDPTFYHQDRNPKTDKKVDQRDELELYILQKALKDKKPFLGICRGCQVLAVASGGSLYQHLPDQFPFEEHTAHSYDELSQLKHKVLIDQNSRAYEIIGKEEIMVNSGHHQAVQNPGHDLKIVGKSPSGVVEIIEHTNQHYFCLGIQGHPEALKAKDLDKFFEAFSNAIEGK